MTHDELVKENTQLKEQVRSLGINCQILEEDIRKLEEQIIRERDKATTDNILAQMATEESGLWL